MWIRLVQHWRFPEQGFGNRGRLYSPGHVRQVEDSQGRALCAHLIGGRPVAQEISFTPRGATLTAGVLCPVEVTHTEWMETLELEVQQGEAAMAWDHTLLWDGACSLRIDLIPRGFDLLDTWDIVVPLVDGVLAADLATAEARAELEPVIGDLRVPVYDTRLIFARRNPTTEAIMAGWRDDVSGDRALTFLKALARAEYKPLLCAVPADWIVRDE